MINVDASEVYDVITGQTINDIEDITEDQLKEILDIKKELQKQPI